MGRVVAIDPGTKRIGVAVSNSTRSLAFPRTSIDAGPLAIAQIAQIVSEESADLVVVGRPVSLNGTSTPSTDLADAFRRELSAVLAPIEVVDCDERFSTVTASRALRDAGVRARDQRELVDSAAATVLLQSFLDAHET